MAVDPSSYPVELGTIGGVEFLRKKVIQEGTGPQPTRGQKVWAHYTGMLTDGRMGALLFVGDGRAPVCW